MFSLNHLITTTTTSQSFFNLIIFLINAIFYSYLETNKVIIILEYKTINYPFLTLFRFSKHSLPLFPHPLFLSVFWPRRKTSTVRRKTAFVFGDFFPRLLRNLLPLFLLRRLHSLAIFSCSFDEALDLSVVPFQRYTTSFENVASLVVLRGSL